MAGEVQYDAGNRERRPEADPERDHQADVEDEDPDQRNRQTEGRQHEVLPSRLQRGPASAVGDQQRRGAGGRLDQQPGDAEVVDQRDREQRGPEQMKSEVVPSAGARGPKEASSCGREIGGGDERAEEPDHRDHGEKHAARAVDQIPGVMSRRGALCQRDDRECDCGRSDRERPHDVDSVRGRRSARELNQQTAGDRQRRDGDHQPLNHGAPPRARCRSSRARRGSWR